MTDALRAQLADAAEKLEMTQQQAARLAMQIGLRDLAAVSFDLSGSIHAQSKLSTAADSHKTGHSKKE